MWPKLRMPNRITTRRIALGGHTVEYTLERKRVKNINLRVRPDGSVFVSCPYLTPQSRIDAFLRAEERRILAALRRCEAASHRRPQPEHCADGERVSVWGVLVTLRFVRGTRGGGLVGDELRLAVRDPDDEQQRRRVLERKRVKNINLRVRPDGSVFVSCPYLTPQSRIDAFLRAEERRILAALRRCEAASHRRPQPEHCADGERVSVWGEPVTLRFVRGTRGGGLVGDELRLAVRDPDDEQQRRRALERWQRQSCEETLTALCRQVYPAFAARGVAWPELRFRRMRSRWGSCQAKSGVVTFNLFLAELPVACALYVAAHEFTHFLQPNHSAAFYAELSRVLPDWAERRALLRQWE